MIRISDLLRHVIHAERLSQPELAKLLGVNPGTLSSWKVGTSRPNPTNAANVRRICAQLHKPCERCPQG